MLTKLPVELLDMVIDQLSSSRDLKRLGEDDDKDPHAFSKLNFALTSLKFPDDQLESFRWEVPTCIPSNLFCGKDAFLGKQRNIRSITLITDSICAANGMTQNAVDLVQFKKLESLSWKGFNSFGNYKSYSACIKAHGHQLKSLTLDELRDVKEYNKWLRSYLLHEVGSLPTASPPNFTAQKVFNLERGSQRVIFDSLENLHLSSVSFANMGLEMLYAFNVEKLTSLRLRRCESSLKWLQEILKSGKAMSLKSFEFALSTSHQDICTELATLGHEYLAIRMTEIICGFIRRNPGLENLSLMLPECFDWDTLADTLTSHHHRLARLVLHQLGGAPSMRFGMARLMETSIPWTLPLESLLQSSQLTSFGSPVTPGELTLNFQMMNPRPSLKLIHFRISSVFLESIVSHSEPDWRSTYKNLNTSQFWGTGGDVSEDDSDEIFDFAEWAFSADGLPNLQIIAGDLITPEDMKF
ncbi:hypothetical protein N7493_008551 [Penicillium malachiteum]|uniref:Uncharacterized protein n=1 Tax=Penicillium malachiteum TaxID=1324776 RepID=A0AAD6HHE6_9EURO|nr:hypothetical protein N7493_008551 [Penicillium malachiteum]